MRFAKVWVVARKDLAVFRQKKSILYTVAAAPLLIGIGLPMVLRFAGARSGGIPPVALPPLLDSFAFFFVIWVVTLPAAIASYSLVGEKVERSLEPLLATPTTTGEILMGKSVAAFFPPIVSVYLGQIVFMVLSDAFTVGSLGYLYYPNWTMAVVLFAVTPLACLLGVESSVFISSRVADLRVAQQLSGLLVLPFAALYVAGEIGAVPLHATNLLVIAGALAIIDVLLFFVTRSVFRREEILTRWK